MVKIIIKRDDLLRQIPPGVDLPAEIILDGKPYSDREMPEHEYPDVFPLLTGVEWDMFCELADRGMASVRDLSKHLKHRDDVFVSNNIAVHIKSIRKKIRDWNLPYIIETKRMGAERGIYILKKLST